MVAAEYEFLRLKNIELGYSLPKNLWRNTTVISGIRLFVRGTNLLTFSNLICGIRKSRILQGLRTQL